TLPSTKRNTVAEKPPISRLELAAMASNTGCASDGEEAITLRMSAVAAWRSGAARSSLCSRAIPDGPAIADREFARFEFSGLGLPAFDARGLSFEGLSFEGLSVEGLSFEVLGLEAFGFDAFGLAIAALRLVAVGRFAAF